MKILVIPSRIAFIAIAVSIAVVFGLGWIKASNDAATDIFTGTCNADRLVAEGSDSIRLRVECNGKKGTTPQRPWIVDVKKGDPVKCTLHADLTASCEPPKKAKDK